jgi:hypothetical protein
MDFLNTKKIIFLASWILQHVYKLQRVLANIPKNIKILFLGVHFLFTINVWIKKSQRDKYPKYY